MQRIQFKRARCVVACASMVFLSTLHANPSSPPPGNSPASGGVTPRANAPAWFRSSYLHALRSPLPALIYTPTVPAVIPKFQLFRNEAGFSGNYQPGGPVTTAGNAFFQSLGTNGRSCVTCHQPSAALSVSVEHVRAVFAATAGRDPLFAPVDGANCPNQVPAANTSGALLGGRMGSATLSDRRAAHSLLLNKGLFRIFLPVPKQTTDASPRSVEFTIEVVSDPNGCNTDPAYNQMVDASTGEVTQIISVYRRPLISSNLKFKTTTVANFPELGFAPGDPFTGGTLPIDPFTGQYVSRNIMWDGRELTLQSQAISAVLIHSQATTPPTDEQVAQMVEFQNGIFNAQERLGRVTLSKGANGGAKFLSARAPMIAPFPFDEFDVWNGITPATPAEELQASIARGQAIFNTFQFPFKIGNNVAGSTCAVCHGQMGGGNEAVQGGQQNTGVGGQSAASNGPLPDPALPIFKLTCVPGANVGNDGAVVLTNDPGLALITGRCEDIGRFTVPTIRALAGRAPYFHDGSAATAMDIVNFYDQRFTIGLTDPQKQDLVNFLSSL